MLNGIIEHFAEKGSLYFCTKSNARLHIPKMDSTTSTTTTTSSTTSDASCNQSYMSYLGQQLQELYESKLFCDLTLKSASPNGTEDALKCHRVVLAAASTHLKDRLSDDVSELDLAPMTSSTLELVICYIYTGSCSIEERNVCELLEASKSWNLPHLSEGCFAYMERTISTKNACHFYEYASYYQNMTIMDAVSHFIRQNFEQLHTSGQIKALSLSSFCSIISSDRINIVSEDSIFASAITLIQKPESTAEEVTRCFQLIRYEYFTGEFFFDSVMFHPLMKESPQKEFLKNAVAYHCSKDNPSIALQPRMERRSWTQYRDERLVYIGYDRRMYAMDDQGRAQVMPGGGIPEWMDEFSSASSYKSQLIIVGGGDIENVNSVAMIDCLTMTLSMLPAVPLTLSRAGVLYTGQHIHVVGGGHSGSRIPVNYVLPVGRYDWETCEQMARPVSRPLVAQRGSLIYIIGGYVGEVLAGVAVYNIRTATWRQVKEMPHGCTRYNAGVVINQDKLTVITPKHCMTYDSEGDEWGLKSYPSRGDEVQVVMYKGDITACVKNRNIYSIQKYDPKSNAWTVKVKDVPDMWVTQFFYNIHV